MPKPRSMLTPVPETSGPGLSMIRNSTRSRATAPAAAAMSDAGHGRSTLAAQSSITQAAIATAAQRKTSHATSVASVPRAPELNGPTLTVYQVKKTLKSSTNAPMSEIQTARDTAPRSTLGPGTVRVGPPPVGPDGGGGGGGGGGGSGGIFGSVDMQTPFRRLHAFHHRTQRSCSCWENP